MANDLTPTGKKFTCAASDGSQYTVIEYQKVFDERTRGVPQMQGAVVYRIDPTQVDAALAPVVSGSLNKQGLRQFRAHEPIGLLTQIDQG